MKKILSMSCAVILLLLCACSNTNDVSVGFEATPKRTVAVSVGLETTPKSTISVSAATEPAPVVEESQNTVSGLRPEFKAAMDSYEAFYDEYCTFLQNYMENPTDLSLILKYTEMLSELERMSAAFDAWEETEMSNEEIKYYLDVNNRVLQKLIDVTG